MPRAKRSMTVEICHNGKDTLYYVTQAVNSTAIPVDTAITKKAVEQLIIEGVQVTVKAPRETGKARK